MKKTLLLLTILMASVQIVSAQRDPLRGSGILINKSFRLTDFDKIELYDLDGSVEVTAGQPYEIAVRIDDNLENLLELTVTNRTLIVRLKGNLNNRLYIEKTNIRVKIALPQLDAVVHRSNGKLTVNGLAGQMFSLKNTGNGNAILNGQTDKLEITSNGNGNVYAEKLAVKLINIKSTGNGNVYVKAGSKVATQSSGNGSIIVQDRKKENR